MTASARRQPRAIATVEELQEMTPLRHWLVARPVTLHLPGLDAERGAYWQLQLNRQLGVCGCKEGGALAWVLIGTYSVFLLTDPAASAMGPWEKFYIGCAVAAVGAVIGKMLGLLHSAHRFRRAVHQLTTELGR